MIKIKSILLSVAMVLAAPVYAVAAFTIPNVAITGGSVDGATIGATTVSTVKGSTVTSTGQVIGSDGSSSAPGLGFSGEINTGFYRSGAGAVKFTAAGSDGLQFTALAIRNFNDTGALQLGSSSSTFFQITRDGPHAGAQRNGTNAQIYRLYNTYTDSSNYERLGLNWSSNVLLINAEAAGSGTQRNISLQSAGGNVLIGAATDDGNNKLQITGSVKHTKQEVDASYTYSQPTTGQTVTLSSGTETAIIDPTGTLATLTVSLPSCTSGYDGSIARYSSTQIITTLTVGTAGGSVVGAPSSLAVGVGNGYICRGSTTTWYRLY